MRTACSKPRSTNLPSISVLSTSSTPKPKSGDGSGIDIGAGPPPPRRARTGYLDRTASDVVYIGANEGQCSLLSIGFPTTETHDEEIFQLHNLFVISILCSLLYVHSSLIDLPCAGTSCFHVFLKHEDVKWAHGAGLHKNSAANRLYETAKLLPPIIINHITPTSLTYTR